MDDYLTKPFRKNDLLDMIVKHAKAAETCDLSLP
jgi:CheY-like chemotaxis protein